MRLVNKSKQVQVAARPHRYRFGTRWLLVLILVFAALFAWFARESHRVSRQTQLISDLAQCEIRVRLREPTGLALVARKLLGPKDVWLTEWISPGWFWRPRVLVAWTMTDQQVPMVVERVKRLGVVQELHLEESPVSRQGLSALKTGLPNVSILSRADLLQVKLQPTAQSAAPAFRYMATVGTGILAVVMVLVWPFLRRLRHSGLGRLQLLPRETR